MTLRILLVDDHVVVRQGLRALLEKEGFEIVGEASDGQQAIGMTEKLRPDVTVLDVALPILNGIDAARHINKTCPRTRTVVLTMYTEDAYVLESLRAGVTGFVLKGRAVAELVQAIREVCKGGIYLSPSVSRTVVRAFLSKRTIPAELLTVRERQVLQLVAEGKTTKEIAALLGVSVKTVDSHRTNIMQKLEIHDTAGLVRYAIRHGLIRP